MAKNIKVLHLLRSVNFSGAENVVCQIIRLFGEDNNFIFAYCSPNGAIKNELEKRGILYYPLESFSITEIRKCMRVYKPDIIHAHDISASVMASLATIGTNVKVISHVHVNNANMASFNIKTLLYLLSCIRYKHIFFVSKSCYEGYFFRRLIKHKSSILTNVMEKDDIFNRAISATDKSYFDIVYVGRITYQKNPEKLVRVLSMVIQKDPSIKIGIIGTGDLMDSTCKLVSDAGLTESIIFKGFVSNPLGILAQAKIMIMTSRFEGLPMTVLESLALGVPVISTPVDGLLDVIKQNINGLLIEDETDMANNIIELLADEKKLASMSEYAKDSFDKICDTLKYKEKIKENYLYAIK